MKIIRYSFILALSALLLGTWTSCDITTLDDDAFLEEHPKTTYGFDNAFQSSRQINDCVTACYMGVRFAYFGEDPIWLGWGSDLMDRRDESWEGNFTNWTTSGNPFRDPTNSLWQRVAAPAILGLDGLRTETLEISEDDRNYFEAQLRFFRGFVYLRLGEMFGGWFIVDKTYYAELKFDIPRSTRAETYEFAIQDLKFAAEYLQDHPEAGRIGKGAAYHFLSEAYLALAIEKGNNATDLETAISYADKALTLHPIMTQRFGTRAKQGKGETRNGVAAYYPDGDVFFDLFQPGNFDYDEGNTESIWAFQMDYDNFIALGKSSWGRNGMHRYYLPSKRTVQWNAKYKNGKTYPWRGNVDEKLYPGGEYSAYVGGKPTQTWFPTDYVVRQIWEGEFADDMRNNELNIRRNFKCTDSKHPLYGQIVTREMVDTTTLNSMMSFAAPTYTKFAPIDDWCYFDLADGGERVYRFYDSYAVRSAETVLLRAEAKLRKGDKAGCASDINILRNRAQCRKLATAGEMDIKYILAERVRELYLEEWRWATLLRMGQDGINSINEHAMHIVPQPCYNNLPTHNVAPITRWTLLPIYENIISGMKDADVKNNPGWD